MRAPKLGKVSRETSSRQWPDKTPSSRMLRFVHLDPSASAAAAALMTKSAAALFRLMPPLLPSSVFLLNGSEAGKRIAV